MPNLISLKHGQIYERVTFVKQVYVIIMCIMMHTGAGFLFFFNLSDSMKKDVTWHGVWILGYFQKTDTSQMLEHKRVRNPVTINKAINTLSMSPSEYQQFHLSKRWLEMFICNYSWVGMKRAIRHIKEINAVAECGCTKTVVSKFRSWLVSQHCLIQDLRFCSISHSANHYNTITLFALISAHSHCTMWPRTENLLEFS